MSDIYKALINSDLYSLKAAISNGDDLNKTITMSQRPVHLAVLAKRNEIEMLKELLDNGAKIDTPGIQNRTALHIAVSSGKEELVKFLIEKGANVNAVDRNKKTPLHLVGSRNQNPEKITSIAITLANHGANIHARDDKEQTPMDNGEIKHALDNKENQKNIGSGDEKEPDLTAFLKPQKQINSKPKLKNGRNIARNLGNDKKEGIKTNKIQGGPKH